MKKILGVCICTLLIATIFYAPVSLMAEEVIGPQNNSNDIGWYTSLVLDDSDCAHISYYDYEYGDLKYCCWNGDSWDIQVVDSSDNVGRYTSLVLDDDGNPHISYYDYTNRDLKYAYNDGDSWEITSIDRAGKKGLFSCIALDEYDYPHISYVDYNSHFLKYAFWNGSKWNKEILDKNVGSGEYFSDTTSIAIDSSNCPHISYYDNKNLTLRYAHFDGVTWNKESLDKDVGNTGQYSSLVLDSNDNPHIAYASWTNFDLRYAHLSGGSWSIETVDGRGDVRKWVSIDLDLNDRPHISYYDYTEGALKYVFWDGYYWCKEAVDTEGSTGCFNSICLTSDDRPCISYYDWGNKVLKYASLIGEEWLIDVIEANPFTDSIDQEQIYCSGYGIAIEAGKPVAQSFIPTTSVLSRVDVMIVKRFNPGGFCVSIREKLSGEDLTSVYLTSNEVAEDLSWKTFNFPDIDVVPGQTYYIVCSSENTESHNMHYCYLGDNDPYKNGNGWIGDSWKELKISGFPGLDLCFRTYGAINERPSIPTINGQTDGEVGVEYSYDISATDEDSDALWYEIDWGISENELIGPYVSGEIVVAKHTWSEKGDYIVRVKAIDDGGAESNWAALEVTMPKNKVFNTLFVRFMEKHPCMFPLIRQLMGLP